MADAFATLARKLDPRQVRWPADDEQGGPAYVLGSDLWTPLQVFPRADGQLVATASANWGTTQYLVGSAAAPSALDERLVDAVREGLVQIKFDVATSDASAADGPIVVSVEAYSDGGGTTSIGTSSVTLNSVVGRTSENGSLAWLLPTGTLAYRITADLSGLAPRVGASINIRAHNIRFVPSHSEIPDNSITEAMLVAAVRDGLVPSVASLPSGGDLDDYSNGDKIYLLNQDGNNAPGFYLLTQSGQDRTWQAITSGQPGTGAGPAQGIGYLDNNTDLNSVVQPGFYVRIPNVFNGRNNPFPAGEGEIGLIVRRVEVNNQVQIQQLCFSYKHTLVHYVRQTSAVSPAPTAITENWTERDSLSYYSNASAGDDLKVLALDTIPGVAPTNLEVTFQAQGAGIDTVYRYAQTGGIGSILNGVPAFGAIDYYPPNYRSTSLRTHFVVYLNKEYTDLHGAPASLAVDDDNVYPLVSAGLDDDRQVYAPFTLSRWITVGSINQLAAPTANPQQDIQVTFRNGEHLTGRAASKEPKVLTQLIAKDWLDVPARASTSEAQAASNNEKYMTPASTLASIIQHAGSGGGGGGAGTPLLTEVGRSNNIQFQPTDASRSSKETGLSIPTNAEADFIALGIGVNSQQLNYYILKTSEINSLPATVAPANIDGRNGIELDLVTNIPTAAFLIGRTASNNLLVARTVAGQAIGVRLAIYRFAINTGGIPFGAALPAADSEGEIYYVNGTGSQEQGFYETRKVSDNHEITIQPGDSNGTNFGYQRRTGQTQAGQIISPRNQDGEFLTLLLNNNRWELLWDSSKVADYSGSLTEFWTELWTSAGGAIESRVRWTRNAGGDVTQGGVNYQSWTAAGGGSGVIAAWRAQGNGVIRFYADQNTTRTFGVFDRYEWVRLETAEEILGKLASLEASERDKLLLGTIPLAQIVATNALPNTPSLAHGSPIYVEQASDGNHLGYYRPAEDAREASNTFTVNAEKEAPTAQANSWALVFSAADAIGSYGDEPEDGANYKAYIQGLTLTPGSNASIGIKGEAFSSLPGGNPPPAIYIRVGRGSAGQNIIADWTALTSTGIQHEKGYDEHDYEFSISSSSFTQELIRNLPTQTPIWIQLATNSTGTAALNLVPETLEAEAFERLITAQNPQRGRRVMNATSLTGFLNNQWSPLTQTASPNNYEVPDDDTAEFQVRVYWGANPSDNARGYAPLISPWINCKWFRDNFTASTRGDQAVVDFTTGNYRVADITAYRIEAPNVADMRLGKNAANNLLFRTDHAQTTGKFVRIEVWEHYA